MEDNSEAPEELLLHASYGTVLCSRFLRLEDFFSTPSLDRCPLLLCLLVDYSHFVPHLLPVLCLLLLELLLQGNWSAMGWMPQKFHSSSVFTSIFLSSASLAAFLLFSQEPITASFFWALSKRDKWIPSSHILVSSKLPFIMNSCNRLASHPNPLLADWAGKLQTSTESNGREMHFVILNLISRLREREMHQSSCSWWHFQCWIALLYFVKRRCWGF